MQDSLPTNVRVKVGNREYSVVDGQELDITNAFSSNDIPLNGTKFKEITISSSTNGRIVACVYTKMFIGY